MKLKDILQIKKNPEFSTATIEGADIPLEMERHSNSDIAFLQEKYVWEFYTVASVLNTNLDLLMSEVSKIRLTDGYFGSYSPHDNEGTVEYYYQKYSVQINGIGEAVESSYGLYSFEVPSGNSVNGGGTIKSNVKKRLTPGTHSKGVLSLEDDSKIILDNRFKKYLDEYAIFNRKSEINIAFHLRNEADLMNYTFGETPITVSEVLSVASVYGPQASAVGIFSTLYQLFGKYLAKDDKPPVIVDNINMWHFKDTFEYDGSRPAPGYSKSMKQLNKDERAPRMSLLKEPLLEKIEEFII